MISGGAVIIVFISWLISLLILILVIAQGFRVGMRWSRKDECHEQIGRGELPRSQLSTYRDGESMFNYKPKKKFK